MYTNGKRLLNQSTTPAASFGCVVRVNQHTFSASLFRFVLNVLCKLIPSRIRDAFGQAVVLEHLLAVNLFESDYTIFVDQPSRKFMCKVLAAVGNFFMNVSNDLSPFGSFRSAFLCFGQSALSTCKSFLISTKETWIRDFLTVRESGETFQSNVDTNGFARIWQRLRFYLASKVGVPIANRVAANSQRFDLPLNRSVQNKFYAADFGDIENVTFHGKSKLLEREAVISSVSLKAWITRFITCLDTAKESLESQINTLLDILENLRIYLVQLRLFLLPIGEHIVGYIQRYRFLFLLPGILTGGQRFVVNPSAQFQCVGKDSSLMFCWIHPILKGFTHNCSVSRISVNRNNLKRLNRMKPLYPTVRAGGLYGLEQ